MKNLTIVAVILIFMACENEPSSSFVAHETEVDETQTDLSLTDETQNPDSDEEGSIIKDVDSDSETADISEEDTDTPQIVDEDTGEVTEEDTGEVTDEDIEVVDNEIPEEYCGNGVVEEGEICDGQIIDCTELDDSYTSGTANCLNTCDGFNETKCVGGEYNGPYEFDVTISGENKKLVAEKATCLYQPSNSLSITFEGSDGTALNLKNRYDEDIYEDPYQDIAHSMLTYGDNGTYYSSKDAYAMAVDFLGLIATRTYLKATVEFFGPLGGGTINTETIKFLCEIPQYEVP